MSKLIAGDFVIVDTCDRPNAGHVAVVIEVSDRGILCRYLSAHLDCSDGKPWNDMLYPLRSPPTLCGEFGVRIKVGPYQYEAIKEAPSTARYEDGRTREWQESVASEAVQPLTKSWWPENYPKISIHSKYTK